MYIVTYLSENLCPKEIQSFSIKTLMRKSKIHFTTPFLFCLEWIQSCHLKNTLLFKLIVANKAV